MDLNSVALWFAALNAGSLFAQSAPVTRRRWDWLAVSTLVLGTAGIGWFLFPNVVGYVAGTLSLLLIILPNWANGAASRAVQHARHRRARMFSRLAALLHPSRDWRPMPRLFAAFELAYLGKTGEAEAELQRLARGTSSVAPMAFAHRLRILARWREIKSLVERPEPGARGAPVEPTLIAAYVRALGELGCIDDLADFMLANEAQLSATGTLDPSLLSLFAFSGQVELTRRVLGGTSRGYAEETRDFWLAVAAEHAGDPLQARLGFGPLRQARDAQIRVRAEERFKSLAHAEPRTPPSAQTLAIVSYFSRAFIAKHKLLLNSPVQFGQRLLTTLLTTVNTVVYVVGNRPHSFETREEFGKRWSFFAPDILAGEWWRAFSYMFVHANFLHLIMNMGGLWVLGPFVERAYGRLRFAIIYLASGALGSAVYLGATWYGLIKPDELVGASGCIMGLLGAIIAVMLRAWFRQRAPMAKALLFRLLVVVLVQVLFDYRTPQVAGLAHALGLVGGLLCGLLLRDVVSESPTAERARLA